MFKHEKVVWITRTAVLIALTVALQALTLQLGNTIITGSIVNLMLIIAVMTCGLFTGLSVAAVTPIIAALLGILPTWLYIPFIAIGNMVLVSAWHFFDNSKIANQYISYGIALIVGALAKFSVIHFGIVWFLMGIRTFNIAALMANPLSIPQLITAATGGVCAIILLPSLLKAIKQRKA